MALKAANTSCRKRKSSSRQAFGRGGNIPRMTSQDSIASSTDSSSHDMVSLHLLVCQSRDLLYICHVITLICDVLLLLLLCETFFS